ncbi:MAG: ArsR family transcriptional regulator [Candidatus ainarchaeum sp.]|nr:ArsR family transcriptional regulator [Candidatus ainarchaeum sp.]
MKKDSFKLNAPHKCFNVLGNELRYKIIQSLTLSEKSVLELCNELEEEQSKISHSLTQLKECSFVDFKVNGKERIYYLKSDVFTKNKPIFQAIAEHVEKYCKYKY